MVLYLHGSGVRGTDNERHVDNGYVERLICGGNCIVLAPQCPQGETWMGTEKITMPPDRLFDYDCLSGSPNCVYLKNFTDRMAAEYNGDRDRICLVGRSMGAHAIWRLIQMYPDWAAACVCVAGGADLRYVDIYKEKHIRMYHGSADTIVPVTTAQRIYDGIKAAGGDKISLTVCPGADHMGIDEYAAKDDGMYRWMFSKRGGSSPCPFHAGTL